MGTQQKLAIQVTASVALLYAATWPFIGSDLRVFNFPWLMHIRLLGPVAAFGVPFSNYTPPYLYLLSAASVLPLSNLAVVKLLSFLGTAWLAISVRQLLISLECEKHDEAALLTFLLPSVLINGPLLGQCDAFWAACCLLAVAASIEKRIYVMAVWAGLGFVFKAQAAFIAPFAFAAVVHERKWWALAIPPAIYAAAIAPAAVVGWPLYDLLTVYHRQFAYKWLSNAPNLWAVPALFNQRPSFLFGIGYAIALVAAATYVAICSRMRPRLETALLAAILIPFLLPKMHERYFFLADVLAFCLAYTRRDRVGVVLFLMIQSGSLLSLISYLLGVPVLNAIGFLPMTAGLVMAAKVSSAQPRQHREDRLEVPPAIRRCSEDS
jgi:Gpi18-like mannosyltransferase